MSVSITGCDLTGTQIDVNGDGTGEASQEWLITTSEPTGTIFVEANAHSYNANFPVAGQLFYDGYSTHGYLQAVHVSFRYKDSPKSKSVFIATVQFVTPGAPNAPQITRDPTIPPTGDPLDEPPVIYMTVAKDKEPFMKDLDGKAVCSSAGEPYNPVQERDRTLYSLHIERNVATDNSVSNETYKDAVNENDFWGRSPGCAKCEIPGLVQRLYTPDGTKYFRETWEFSFDDNGYQLVLHDWGYKRLIVGIATTIVGADGEFLTAPTYLDGSGVPLSPQPPDSDPVDLPEFKRYKVRDFDDIALPEEM